MKIQLSSRSAFQRFSVSAFQRFSVSAFACLTLVGCQAVSDTLSSVNSGLNSINSSLQSALEPSATPINILNLCQEHKDNEVSARNKWEHKYVLVTGKINSISNSFLPSKPDSLSVLNNKETVILLDLGSKNGQKLVQNSVIVGMKASEFNKVSNLKAKQTITLKGKIVGIDVTNMSSISSCSVQLEDGTIR